MAYRRRYKKKSRKYISTTRVGRRESHSRLYNRRKGGLTAQIVPRQTWCKVKWELSKTLTTSSIDTYQFRLNSIYDPDLTTGITSLSVLGWTELNSLYQLYKVYGCKVEIWCVNTYGSNQMNQIAFYPDAYNTSVVSSASVASAQPMAMFKCITNTGGPNVSYMKRYYSMKKVVGHTITDDNYGALMGANPTNVVIGNLVIQNIPTGATSITFNIRLTYYTNCYGVLPFAS